MELTGFGEFDGVELLQKLPIFAKLSFDETARLAKILQRADAPEGAVIIEENALGDALYVLHEGEVRVSRDMDGDGIHQQHEEIGRLGPGSLFGEMALVDDLLTSARVTTVRPCKLLKLPRKDFLALLDSDDRLAVKVYQSFCRTLSDRLRRANAQLSAKVVLALGVR